MFKYLFTYLIYLTISYSAGFAQKFSNQIFSSEIKTVLCHKKGWPLSYPVIRLGSNETISVSFDDLADDTKNYYYSIVHCNKNWETSLLSEGEYLDGFNQVSILDYEFSFNTTINYVHYKLEFPNQDIHVKKSGNYIIKVYEDNNVDSPVFTQKFMITEPLVGINTNIKYTMNANERDAFQEINFTIDHPNFTINNPLQDISVQVFQNQRIDNAITSLKPQFIKENQLIYNYNRETLFEGGNEFRWLDIRSTRFFSDKIKDITFHEPYYHIELFNDIKFPNKSYFFKNDFNGRYVIENKEDRDPEIESDYVIVHFYLSKEAPFSEEEVYLLGDFTQWLYTSKNKLNYNPDSKCYEANLLLKQGFYNYQYITVNASGEASVKPIEGSFSETENDYLILVYYRGLSDDYDRIIGVVQTNSLKP